MIVPPMEHINDNDTEKLRQFSAAELAAFTGETLIALYDTSVRTYVHLHCQWQAKKVPTDRAWPALKSLDARARGLRAELGKRLGATEGEVVFAAFDDTAAA